MYKTLDKKEFLNTYEMKKKYDFKPYKLNENNYSKKVTNPLGAKNTF